MLGVLLYSGVSLCRGCPYVGGVLMSGVPLYSGVSLCQGCPYVRCALMSGVSLCQGCLYVRGVLMSGVSLCQGCPLASYPGHVGGGKSGLVSTVSACANDSGNYVRELVRLWTSYTWLLCG